MSLSHVRFRFEVELRTDAHIGTGEIRKHTELRPHLAARVEDADVAVVARDHAERVTIPSTALKGTLRAALLQGPLEAAEREKLVELFGRVDGEPDAATMGRFAFYPAVRLGASLPATDLPCWHDEEGTWIATHVSLSRASGTAERHHLYSTEVVPSGTRFRVEGCCFANKRQAKADLAMLLAPLRSSEGLSIGANTRFGLGALALVGTEVAFAETRFDTQTGEVVTDPEERLTVPRPSAHEGSTALRLRCDGPFASVDPHRRSKANRIPVLRRNDRVPVLQAASLVGALRARAAWIAAVNGMGGDDRFRALRGGKGAAALTPTERLFGVTGWRGLLRFGNLVVAADGQCKTMTQIALDRFSGAVLDGTLFEHEIFVGVTLEARVRLDRRTDVEGLDYPNERDLKLYDLLIKDLVQDGLRLGHATNRGFGWFDVALQETRTP